MKKRNIAIIFLVLILVLIIVKSPRDIYYTFTHKRLWSELSDQLKNEKVIEITIDNVNHSDINKDEIVLYLQMSTFYKSNWRQEGPTGTILTLVFEDGHTQHFQYWGRGRFETTYKEGQFLIESDKMESVFDYYGIEN